MEKNNISNGIHFGVTLQPIFDVACHSSCDCKLAIVGKVKMMPNEKDEHPPKINPSWQHENKYNRFLPYHKKLCEDADRHLADIKAGFGRSILLRQPFQVVGHWSSQLEIYISLNGYRFTKEDHILFVKIFYEILSTPNIDLNYANVSCIMVSLLLEKPRLLNRDDLELDWRPLHRLYKFLNYKKMEEHRLLLLPSGIVSSVETTISRCRIYFSLNSTKEILAEFRPYMCPTDTGFQYALNCMLQFLTTDLPVEQNGHGYKLWLDELLYWWMNETDANWEDNMLDLLRRLPHEAYAHDVDLKTFLPFLFTKILRNLELPLTYYGNRTSVVSRLASLIVNTMGGENVVQKYIKQIFFVLESFVHPSNDGPWQFNILNFLYYLSCSLCNRVHRERYHKAREWRWQYNTQLQLKLTDAQIDEFVSSVLPCALNGMFAIEEADTAAKSLKMLSHLSPKLVVPVVLDRLFIALDAILEPHRLTQSLNSLKSIIVPLVRSVTFRKHVVPLMVSLLPGLDANDLEKCSLASDLLASFFLLVPIVDCSSAVSSVHGLTKEEKSLCLATSVFEKFVNQLMDKIFLLVEMHGYSSNGDYMAPLSDEEDTLKSNIYKMTSRLFSNCSRKIYDVILDRIYNFISENVFQSRAAADFVADLCYNIIQPNPSKAFVLFFNFISLKIENLIAESTSFEDGNCWELIWYLRLCSGIIICDGDVLVREKDKILRLLRIVEPLTVKTIFETVSDGILSTILYLLTDVYDGSDSVQNSSNVFEQSFTKSLPIQHWAETHDLNQQLDFTWHLPNEDELDFAKNIIQLFIIDQLNKFEFPEKLSNNEILKSLHYIKHSFRGAASLLPKLEGQNIPLLRNNAIDVSTFECVCHVIDSLKFDINGENVRNFMYKKLHNLMKFLIESRSSEPKCLAQICSIYSTIMFFRGLSSMFVTPWIDEYVWSIDASFDQLIGGKSSTKRTHTAAIVLRNNKRSTAINQLNFTETHMLIMKDLITLGTSPYDEVREKAQVVFEYAIGYIWFVGRYLVDDIIALLKEDVSINEDQFQGALELLVGPSKDATLIRQDWTYWHKIWPAIVYAQHSEKQPIIDLLELIRIEMINLVSYFTIKSSLCEKVITLAKSFWTASSQLQIIPSATLPDETIISEAVLEEERRNENSVKIFYELISTLTVVANDKTLHWRHTLMALCFLRKTIRLDFPFPGECLDVFVQCLIHETKEIREQAFCALASILLINRPKVNKVFFDPSELINIKDDSLVITSSTDPWPIKWGFRKDNKCLLYQDDKVPRSKSQWDDFIFVEKTYKGFYCWPEKIRTYERAAKIEFDPDSRTQLKTGEQNLYDAFTNSEYVDKLCQLMMVEGEEGEADVISLAEAHLFKHLFRMFNDSILTQFTNIVESAIEKKEMQSCQKFAATFIVGLVNGAKYWPYEKHVKLWSWLGPVFRNALDSATIESRTLWFSCLYIIFGDRDPRKLYWLIDILFELATEPIDSPLITTNRIAYLNTFLGSQQWRIIEVAEKMLKVIEPQLAQPYQNLRFVIGSLLEEIFAHTSHYETTESRQNPPNVVQLYDFVWDKLSMVRYEFESGRRSSLDSGLQEERDQSILLLKTLLRMFVMKRVKDPYKSSPTEVLRFMPLLFYFANDNTDEELKQECVDELMCGITHWFLDEKNSSEILKVCVQCSKSKWWKSRLSLLKFMQASLFTNLFYYSTLEHQNTIKNIIFSLVKDERLEVRTNAAEVFSGLLHCRFFPTTSALMNEFYNWISSKQLIVQHAGVLGLAAVVKSCPYTVPDYLPDVLMRLCQHKCSPQPIRSTVEDTLYDFKRTHQDSWHEHKERFTDTQLSVLTELLISPNYYV